MQAPDRPFYALLKRGEGTGVGMHDLLERVRAQVAAALEESGPLDALRMLAGANGAGSELGAAAVALAGRLGQPSGPAVKEDLEKPWF